jgi:DNA-binding transcriptional LysR family regulator/ferredoxin
LIYDGLTELVAVSRSRSLAGAAQSLGISRATLARHVDALESELGCRLLTLESGEVSFTREGKWALEAATEVASIEEAVLSGYGSGLTGAGDSGNLVGEQTGVRDIIVDYSCDVSEVGPLIQAAADGMPMRLSMNEQARPVSAGISDLIRNTADVVVAFDSQAKGAMDDAALRVETIARTAMAVMLDPSHPLSARGEVALADLKDVIFLRPAAQGAADRAIWDEFLAACARAGIDPVFRYARVPRQVPERGEATIRPLSDKGIDGPIPRGRVLVPVSDAALVVDAIARSDDAAALDLMRAAASLSSARRRRDAIGFPKIFGADARKGGGAVARGALSAPERASALEMAKSEPVVTEDLILPDSTVVDKAYVALRNRLNRIGEGVGNEPVSTSFEAIMHLWSVEDAEEYLQMPMFGTFTAYDFSVTSGRDLEEARDILDNFASRSLIMRFTQGGVARYSLMSWHDIWEASVANYSPQTLRWGIMGSDSSAVSSYPIYHACPVSADVVRGRVMVPYRDWQTYVASQTRVCVSPCQCRASYRVLRDSGMPDDAIATTLGCGVRGAGESPKMGEECCLMFGEMAEYWESIGVGRPVSTAEALSIARRNVFEGGAVPELAFSKNPEIMCFCRSEYCIPLSAIRATGGNAPTMRNMAAYRLEFDSDACVDCGACVPRCPMGVIDRHGAPTQELTSACVACGQCAYVCPSGARWLVAKDPGEVCEPPRDIIEGNAWRSAERMADGRVTDFVGTRLKG